MAGLEGIGIFSVKSGNKEGADRMNYTHTSGFWPTGVIFCAIFTFTAMACAGTYSGGTGTAADPYKISTVADWQELIGASVDYGKNFILLNDIDFGEIILTPVAPDTDPTIWNGFQGISFTGVFVGNGYTLRSAVVNCPGIDYIGLFGCLGSGGQIQKLGVENITITGRSYVGGLVGSNSGMITACYATDTVGNGDSYVGGLVGNNDHGTLMSCYATGTVNGSSYVGGLAGCNDYTCTITSCYATGTVSGSSCIGGMVGWNHQGTIRACYASGWVSGPSGVGGLVGLNDYSGTITNCYASGSVSGSSKSIGGLVGSNHQGIIMTCYATGPVSGPSGVSGLVGSNNSDPITASFWDIQTSGQTDSSAGKGLTTEQMKTLSIYQNAGWADKGWVMKDGVDYPRLSWENSGGVPIPTPPAIPLAGSGTANDPYRVSSAQEFAALSWYSGILDKQIRLINDLDLKDVPLYPIGDLGGFTGIFDGDGHTLINGLISQPSSIYVGLFSYLGSNGQIRNLDVDNATITGQDYIGSLVGLCRGMITACSTNSTVTGSSYVGGLVGKNTKSITSCIAAGAVNGSNSVGGLAGVNDYSGTLTSCYATGKVSGVSSVGGLVAGSRGPITNCYAIGTVSGSDHVGGLMGQNGSAITGCYAIGTVIGSFDSVGGLIGLNDYSGTITSCYATGAVSGNDSVGGLVGTNNHSITSCYATGAVNGSDSVGGIVGYNIYSGTLTSCYATGFVSGSHDVGGLVGLNGYGTITNGCATGAVSGSSDDIGGLVGWNNSGTVSFCFATGTVIGSDFVGGLVGLNFPGTITSSYATGRVSGFCNDVGGLVGRNVSGTITSCYAVGTVSGSDYVGGLVGYSVKGKQICETLCDDMGCWEYCYTDPNGVEDPWLVQQSFWDAQSSGRTNSTGGTGKTTAEMKTLGTFADAGWDFTTTWAICTGTNYPRLKWQVPKTDWACPDGVGMEDLVYLAGRWMAGTPATVGAADADGNGKVDMVDLAIVSENWMK
jgi:hypothetical protein